MTNKVKPFFIRITDDMTPQIVQDAFDKCVALGAKENEKANEDWFEKLPYFGVCAEDGTYFGIDGGAYVGAQEITLEQLDEWLGIDGCSPKQEWKNGDECLFDGETHWFVGVNPKCDQDSIIIVDYCGDYFGVSINEISKPETPEQKAERERLENGRELWLKHQQALADVKILPSGKNKAWDNNMLSKDEMKSWCILAENVTWIK